MATIHLDNEEIGQILHCDRVTVSYDIFTHNV